MFVYIISCFLVLFFKKCVPQLYQHMQSKSCNDPYKLPFGSQLLLSNSLLFRFQSKKEFILEICKVGHLKKKCLSRGK